MVDIQSATAEIRRGKKRRRKKKKELECGPMPNVMAALPNGIGADQLINTVTRAQNSENPNPHSSKIEQLLPVYGFRNTRRRFDHISDPRIKFGEIRNELRT